MTGITRGELERRLARHLTEEGDRIMATTDIRHQQELLESRLSRARRRHAADAPSTFFAGRAEPVSRHRRPVIRPLTCRTPRPDPTITRAKS